MRGVAAENVEGAIHFLAETDVPYAEAKTDVERCEILRKRTRAREFLDATGTVAEREARAEVAATVETADGQYCDAVLEYERLRARRQRAELVVDLYRTLESSRRVGAIK
jgi:hypothetical protein